ncbi:hypothetical protein C8Q80DRAFT_1269726 [Daedaleopsis nitida]|nr:hypothetical protein C8Q80DRAFT_1269726 [Daedaleopsis nitida]
MPVGMEATGWNELVEHLSNAAKCLGPLDDAEEDLLAISDWLEDTLPARTFLPALNEYNAPPLTVNNEGKKTELLTALVRMLDPRICVALETGDLIPPSTAAVEREFSAFNTAFPPPSRTTSLMPAFRARPDPSANVTPTCRGGVDSISSLSPVEALVAYLPATAGSLSLEVRTAQATDVHADPGVDSDSNNDSLPSLITVVDSSDSKDSADEGQDDFGSDNEGCDNLNSNSSDGDEDLDVFSEFEDDFEHL